MKNIIIAGGGITGLTTALVLEKLGIPYQVFEKMSQLTPAGAGITMAPNAMKVFEWLGIAEKVKENGFQLQRAAISNAQLVPLRPNIRAAISTESGLEITAIHRAALQEVLLAQLPKEKLFLGEEYKSHSIENEQVIVQFTNQTAQGDILLGADGIHSKIRQAIFNNTSLRYSGQTCWRGVATMGLNDSFAMDCIEAWGRKQRFGIAKISQHQVYWFAVQSAEAGGKDNPETLKKDLLALFSNFHPIVQNIIQQTEDKAIIRTDISDLNRLDTWHQGKICLLGDAAHATTPNMGQGGAQGVEDAYFIGNLLKKHANFQAAFAQFEKIRRPKVDYVVNNSWRFGQYAHSVWLQPIIKLAMKWTPESVIVNSLQKVFKLDEV